MPYPQILILDVDVGVSPADLVKAAFAIQQQANLHFSRTEHTGYSVGAMVRAATPDDPAAHDDEWVCGLFSTPDQPGALGYHSVTESGLPFLRVFPLLDEKDGVPWTVTASHEVLEAIRDPWVNAAVVTPSGEIVADEPCDPDESGWYECEGVPVSNFVTAAWYAGRGTTYDYLGRLTKPGEVRAPGGYKQTLDPNTGAWTMTGSMRPGRAAVHALGGSRVSRRALQTAQRHAP